MNSSLRKLKVGNLVGFRETFRWRSNTISRHNPGETFWIVQTSLHKEKFLLFLKYKMLLDQAHAIEQQCLLDLPMTLRDNLFIDSLLAKRRNNVPLEILWPRIITLSQLYGLPALTPQVYKEWSGRFPYCVEEFDRPARKPKKYSGYVRNPSSVGSKRRLPRQELIPEDSVEEYVRDVSFLEYLTVGVLKGRSVSFATS
jgi:hypothetical protein